MIEKSDIKQFELTLVSAPLTADPSTVPGQRELELASARQVLERLRTAEPDGRVSELVLRCERLIA